MFICEDFISPSVLNDNLTWQSSFDWKFFIYLLSADFRPVCADTFPCGTCVLWGIPHQCLPGPAGDQGSAPHMPSPDVLWRIALVAPACRYLHPPCELGNFLVLLIGAGLADYGREQGGILGSAQHGFRQLPRPSLRLVCVPRSCCWLH